MVRRYEISLSPEAVLQAAFRLLDEEGLEALTMRRLASSLSVQAPALYWHVRDKAELVHRMASRIYADARSAVPAAADWRGWLIGFGHALRHTLLAHRDAARLCATARGGEASDAATRTRAIAAPLVALGLDEDKALIFQASVISLTLGWSSYQEGPMHEPLRELMDFDRAFDVGLTALVRGYEGP